MIENPPSTNPLMISEDTLDCLQKEEIATSIKKITDEYLYWTDVKYRAQSLGLTKENLWNAVKYSRMLTDIKIDGFENIHFSLSNSMQRKCHEFDMNFGGSWGASKIFPDDKSTQELYLVSSIMEEAIASSQMEGAATTREVAKDMLRRKISPKDKSQRMILNNYNTINFIRDHAKEDLTPELIMQIHGMMTEGALDVEDAAGRFRKSEENIVVGNGITGETVHTPPSADCLPDFIDRLCVFFNDNSPKLFIHPIIRGIIIHFLIGYYHPFADGNGRTARALFYWYMMRNNYWLVQYLSISRIIRGSKKSYEKAYLYTEHDSNDIGYFIQYNLDVLKKSFDELQKYLIKKYQEKKKSERLLHLGNITPRQAEILNRFIENPDEIMSSVDVMSRFGVSSGTAKSDLKDLTRKLFLKEIALNGRTKGYIRNDSFQEMISSPKKQH
ncbi:MAG: Fic family protein [Muribaculaceae bacterium]|nr:Fic family protein [Muribaculaceae bacterium]